MSKPSWLLIPNPKKAPLMRVICFPYAGGNASTYLSWAEKLPSNVELVAIQPPGRASRMLEPAYSDMATLIDDLIESVSAYLDRPYVIFGHSLGSRVAIELIYQCRLRGLPLPQHFIASGSRGPDLPVSNQILSAMGDDELIDELRKLKGAPDVLLANKDIMKLFLPTLRADLKIADFYRFKEDIKFDCPVTVLRGELDESILLEQAESWGKYFSGSFDMHVLPGGHLFLESEVELLLQYINNITNTVSLRIAEKPLQLSELEECIEA